MGPYELRGGLLCTSPGALVVDGGSVSTYSTTTTILTSSSGKFNAPKTAITNGVTPTTDAVTGLAFPAIAGGASVANTPGKGAIVVWGMTGTTVKCAQGPIEGLDMQGNFIKAPQFPALPEDFVPFAYQVLKAGATASATAIVFGTSNWNATGFTNAIVQVATLPNRPQVS